MMYADDLTLSQVLLRDTSLTRDQLESAVEAQRVEGGLLAEVLRQQRMIPEEELLRAQAVYLGLEYISKLEPDEVDTELLEELPINYAKTHLVMPLYRESGAVKVVLADPNALHAVDDLRTMLGAEVSPSLATTDNVLELINKVYARQTAAVDLEENEEFQGDSEELVDIIDSTDEAPIIRWVNSLIFQAVKERASDIHIEPGER